MAASKSLVSQLITVLLLCSHVTHVVSTEGRLFFCAFMDPSPTTNPNSGIEEIHISGLEGADTKVRVELLPLNRTYMYMLNSTNQWRRTITAFDDFAGPSGVKLPASVIISAEKANISVQCNKAEDGTSGGYLALPITVESTQYHVASYTPRGKSMAFSIAAPYHTCVTVYKQNGPEQTRELDLSLDPGQVYHHSATGDLTGYYIESMKPIAVFTGLDCAYVAKDASPAVAKCDHIVEQMHPKSEFGTSFIISSIPGRRPETGFQIRVMGIIRTEIILAEMDFDPTTNVVGAPVVRTAVTVTRGNFEEFSVGRGKTKPTIAMLSCSQPCLVMQYGESNDMAPAGSEPSVKPDSTMITVPATQHYTNGITFSTSKLYSASGNQTLDNVNSIIVIAKKTQLSTISLDGQPVTSGLSNPESMDVTFPAALRNSQPQVPTDTYSIVYGGLSAGFHRVTSTNKDALYMVFVYGQAPSTSPSESEGYAYLGGMRYVKETNPPILEGPWFDFSQPVGENPEITNPNPGPESPNSPITPTEYPSYESIWEIRFYILHPHLEDLKTRNCSEAYYRYYLEERFYPKQKQVLQMAKDRCASTVTVNMTHMLYYSEYTDGLIRFKLSITATGAVTMNDIMDCLAIIAEDISYIKNWVPVDYKDETSFLRPDAYYNRGCDRLHCKTPNFESFFYGWNCPTRGGVVGASKASGVQVSLGFLLVLALGSVLLLLR